MNEEAEMRLGRRTLSATALKLIAVFSMLFDHLGVTVIEGVILRPGGAESPAGSAGLGLGVWYALDVVFRGIGRLAFPIFAFLLVESFFHTHDRRRYAGRLLLFALLSEVPFDLAFSSGYFDPSSQNIYFTLLIGLLMMGALERWGGGSAGRAGIILAACAAALLWRADYTYEGILLIAAFYLFRGRRQARDIAAGILMAVESRYMLGLAVFALAPISRYSGRRGEGVPASRGGTYFFYWFYPVHLLLLSFLAELVLLIVGYRR